MRHIIMREPLLDEAEAQLERNFIVHRASTAAMLKEIKERVCITALITGGRTGASAEWISLLPALKLIAVNGVGLDAIDLTAASARHVLVTTTPDVLTDDVAEVAIGLILSCMRRITNADMYVRNGRWVAGEPFPLGTRLAGKRVGIVGMGKIGEAIAKRVSTFNVDLGYFSRSIRPVMATRFESLVDLAKWSEVLVVSVAASADTRGLIDATILRALGPKGLLVNVARGSVVDEDALIDALQTDQLGAAGLDVFADEPHVPTALCSMPNVVLMPHIGSATTEARRAMAQIVVSNIINMDNPSRLIGIANP